MKRKQQLGFSLVEIMVAVLVLSVVAVACATALYHAGAVIQNQEQKRMAVDQANERLELLKRTKYSILTDNGTAPFNTVLYFADSNGGDDVVEHREVDATPSVDRTKTFDMVTTIERFPLPNAISSEYVRVSTIVTYDNNGQQVKLDSMIVPKL